VNAQPPPQSPTPPPPPYGRPPQPPFPPPPVSGRAEEGRAYRFWGAEPGGSEWQAWTWTSRARPVPWFGALLLALGIGLLVEQLVPELSFWSLVILALGGAFAVAWLVGRVVGATVPALVLIGWGLARIGSELGYLSGEGWALLFVGIALLIAWAIGRVQHARRDWALVLGAILGLIGLADAADSLPFSLDAAIIIPVALIGAGVWLIWRRGLSTT
jgi:hypothetical protein